MNNSSIFFAFFISHCVIAAPPSILNNSGHAVESIDASLTVLGIPHSTNQGPSETMLAINQTCAGNECSGFLSPSTIIGYATDLSKVEYAAKSTTTVLPLVQYQIISQSSTGYAIDTHEQSNYSSITSANIIYSIAYCGKPRLFDYPPVAFVTVLPNNSGETPISSSGCGYASGIEFSIPVDNINCTQQNCFWTPISGGQTINISSPSSTTAAMSAVLSALKTNHPQWTWGDIKSVLRITASNWNSGYVAYNSTGPSFGYGNINYVAANSYSGIIQLQPPGFSVSKDGDSVTISLYPFKTSRRAGEVVYVFMKQPHFPSPSTNNEYTYSQLSDLLITYDGIVIYRSNGASGIQSTQYSLPLGKTGYFVAFTVDDISDLSTARFSRAEDHLIRRINFGSQASLPAILQTILE